MRERCACDVCVIGGGPAGSTIASRLAAFGYKVVLVDDGRGPMAPRAQHLPPSAAAAFAAAGSLVALQDAACVRPVSRLIVWPDSVARSAPEPGVIIDRRDLDGHLLEHARRSGADVYRPAVVRHVAREGDGWSVRLLSAEGAATVHAQFVVDAAGRRSVLAWQRRPAAGTAATHAEWRLPVPCSSELRVEAGEAGWIWGAPVAAGRFAAVVFEDHAAAAGHSAAVRRQRYHAALAGSALFRALLQGSPVTEVGVCDASARASQEPFVAGRISVGDAAAAIDPISSQGVQAAVRSALHGSIVVNTLLRRPADTAIAIRFYQQAWQRTVRLHTRLAAAAYSECHLHGAAAFWSARAAGAAVRPSPMKASLPPLSPALRLRWADDVAWGACPVIDGEFVRLARAVLHPRLEEPLVYVGGMELPALMGATERRTAAELAQHAPPAMRDGVTRAIVQLYALGVLVAAE